MVEYILYASPNCQVARALISRYASLIMMVLPYNSDRDPELKSTVDGYTHTYYCPKMTLSPLTTIPTFCRVVGTNRIRLIPAGTVLYHRTRYHGMFDPQHNYSRFYTTFRPVYEAYNDVSAPVYVYTTIKDISILESEDSGVCIKDACNNALIEDGYDRSTNVNMMRLILAEALQSCYLGGLYSKMDKSNNNYEVLLAGFNENVVGLLEYQHTYRL